MKGEYLLQRRVENRCIGCGQKGMVIDSETGFPERYCPDCVKAQRGATPTTTTARREHKARGIQNLLDLGAVVLLTLLVAGCDNRTQDFVVPSPFDTPPVIHSFTADATRLGSSFLDTFLRWDVSGGVGTFCRIDSIGQPSQSIGNVDLVGFVQVRPVVSRDYILSCSNRAGAVMRLVSILVG